MLIFASKYVFYVIRTTFHFQSNGIGMAKMKHKFNIKRNKRENAINKINRYSILSLHCIPFHCLLKCSMTFFDLNYLVNCNSVYLSSFSLISPNVKIQCQLDEHEQSMNKVFEIWWWFEVSLLAKLSLKLERALVQVSCSMQMNRISWDQCWLG